MPAARIGGTFAPPFTDELLAKYKGILDSLDPQSALRDVMQKLYDCVIAWWNAPASQGVGSLHPSGTGLIVPLEPEIERQLWDFIPWEHELNSYLPLMNALPTGTIETGSPPKSTVVDQAAHDKRNAIWHLWWLARELDLGREPITNDQL